MAVRLRASQCQPNARLGWWAPEPVACAAPARWAGVPFVMKAGKALNERKVEIRVQFKPPAAGIHKNSPQRNA